MKINIFDTFFEAKQAQEYDHFYQKAVGLATVSGVDLEFIRDNQLFLIENGLFLLENYVNENNIEVIDKDLYEQGLNYWKATNAWSGYFKYQDKFAYTKDHSDICWTWIEVNVQDLISLDNEGNEIITT
jgi:hypothetical protein